MLPMDAHHRRMFAVKKIILFYGIFLSNHICESQDPDWNCKLKNILFISPVTVTQPYFPSNAVYRDNNGIKLCFNIQPNNKAAGCCNGTDFNCNVQVTNRTDRYIVTLTEEILSKQDIVVMKKPDDNYSCPPSQLYNKTSCHGSTNCSFLLNVHNCLNKNSTNIRLSSGGICSNNTAYWDTETCQDLTETQYVIFENKTCVSCKNPYSKTVIEIPLSVVPTTADEAKDVMKNMSVYVEKMGSFSTAELKIGNITGLIAKLPKENQTNMNFAFIEGGVKKVADESSNSLKGSFRSISIPSSASKMAVKGNGSFLGILLFPDMQSDSSRYYFNNEIMGIEMGAKVENLSQTINIQYGNVNKKGANASCMSWDGTRKDASGKQLWIPDGCRTNETNTSITCQCSHLTFFAILMTPPPGNISASDVNSLTYITSIGCGLSLFFLVVGLFMHVLVRKGKASQATNILMNLFIAMVVLNLSFLTNESVAKLQISGACVAIAAVLHYSMLATFSWFFMQALHLYLNLRRISTEVNHYMLKICITGWAIPAVVVISLIASQKYDSININTNEGTAATMCWIPDAAIHQGVNVGYYAVVFIFTLTIFIITVRQIILLPKTGKVQNNSTTKTNTFTILGLLFLLGITWAFAFFSYGSLVIVSYYIFTILNSFQGFFLFIYYYHSSKIIGSDKMHMQSSSSTATSNTAVTNVYK